MLRSLRIRLGLLYLAASLGLVALLGVATYGMLHLYFQRSTDLALQYKMATEYELRGQTLPDSLLAAEQEWFQEKDQTPQFQYTQPATTSINNTPSSEPVQTGEHDDENDEIEKSTTGTPSYSQTHNERDELYDGDLSPVFVLPGSGSSQAAQVPLVDHPAAISQAQLNGSDLRTIQLDDGSHLRLLTYQAPDGSILQVGRLLNDQDRLLSQYLKGLLLLGGAASLLLALGSWLLAGRSIRPAERAWEQQQSFVANASHELRAPLTILRASADYALRSKKRSEKEKSLRDIVEECDYMDRLVEDLLLLSRLDARRLKMEAEPVSIPTLMEEITHQVEKVAAEKGISIEIHSMPLQVLGDPLRLRQVLLILLDNAMRFTPRGGIIRLEAARQGREATIAVIDNGCGIPEEDLPHLFERFYTVSGQPEAERGNGLGLSIAKGLVEAHNGRITIVSKPDQGTTVKITLPLAEK
jgi:signal transduction histidine kinase